MREDKEMTSSIDELLKAAQGPSATLQAALEKADGLSAQLARNERLAELTARQFAIDESLARAMAPVNLGRIESELGVTCGESARLALGPIRDIGRLAEGSAFQAIMDRRQEFARISEQLEARFRMPVLDETARLAAEIAQQVQLTTVPLALQCGELTRAMEAIHTPWLDTADALHSAQSFANLQGIGRTLAESAGFGAQVTGSLRDFFGDWREPVTLSQDVIESISARTALYESLGFDTGLTDFPNAAFNDALSIARLREPIPDIVIVPDVVIPATSSADEPGFERTNRAHNHLQRFEAHLRVFIDTEMRSQYGESWIKHRVPGDVRKKWLEKRETAKDHGDEHRQLIQYADFTDYETIIVRNDNWTRVFENVFRRKENVAESLRRLYPIRLATMHARLISQDDELYLAAEVTRILKAIGVL